MANATFFPQRVSQPETVEHYVSFLGNGAAQPTQGNIYGWRGWLQAPVTTGLNRTGVGLYVLNLRDSWSGAIPYQGTSQVYQSVLQAGGDVFQAIGASTLSVVFQFVGLDTVTAKTIKFTLMNTAGAAQDATSSQLVALSITLLNSSSVVG